MKHFIVVDADIPQLLNNALFNPAEAAKVSHTILPLCYLASQAKLSGLEFVTPDVYEQRKVEPHKAVLMSHMITGNTQRLIAEGVKPAILFSQESPLIALRFFVNLKKYAKKFDHVIVFEGFRRLVQKTKAQFHPMYFPEPYPAKAITPQLWSEKKLVTMISGNKRSPLTFKKILGMILSGRFYRELYRERLQVVEYWSDKGFDLYGMGWNKPMPGETSQLRSAISACYQGPVDDKIAILRGYKFTFTFENTIAPGYLTEKIFDAMVAGSVPIYLGAPDIERFIPTDCFVDMRNYKTMDELEQSLAGVSEETYNKYIAAINRFLTSDGYRKFSQEAFSQMVLSILKPYFA